MYRTEKHALILIESELRAIFPFLLTFMLPQSLFLFLIVRIRSLKRKRNL